MRQDAVVSSRRSQGSPSNSGSWLIPGLLTVGIGALGYFVSWIAGAVVAVSVVTMLLALRVFNERLGDNGLLDGRCAPAPCRQRPAEELSLVRNQPPYHVPLSNIRACRTHNSVGTSCVPRPTQ